MVEDNGISLDGGAGGTIFWNMEGQDQLTTNGIEKNPIVDLAHELIHAFEANNGWMDDRVENNLSRNEWQASYGENVIRYELGYGYNTIYSGKSSPDGTLDPDFGYRLLKNEKPIEPSW